jgi:hypothetical protein
MLRLMGAVSTAGGPAPGDVSGVNGLRVTYQADMGS